MKKLTSTFFTGIIMLVTIASHAALNPGLGGEHFEVYLNDKLILQQGITASYRTGNLPLDNMTASDKLVVHYRNCGGVVAKGRSISIKDEKGKVLREWKFTDSNASAMAISANEILEIQKQHPRSSLKLYYTSTQFSEDRTLASLQFKSDKTVYNH